MVSFLLKPWPWYVTGPLVGLVAVALLAIGNKPFGVSANLRHICAATFPGRVEFFKYDWRSRGLWNLVFVAGVVAGGFLGGVLLANPDPAAITPQAQASLAALGIRDFTGLVPRQLFTWHVLLSVRGLLMMVGGGFLVGFGIVLTKGELASWFRIQEALRFKGPYLYEVFASALAVAAPGFALLKRRARALTGEPIVVPPKVLGSGVRYVAGSVLFGLGWALIGACPGPMFALLGAGVGAMSVVWVAARGGTC